MPISRRPQWAQAAVFAALAALYIAAFTVINFLGFERFCTGDMYEDTYVARLMWEQKTLFPANWVFGNQYYVIATPVLAALFYGLTGSMNLSMALATTVMTALVLSTLWWMLRPFTGASERTLGLLLMAAAVVGPNIAETIEGQILYLEASYYACYVITIFAVFGDYLRARFIKSRGFFTVSLAASLFLSFCTGMQSLRQTAVMVLPLAGFELLSLAAGYIRSRRKPARERLLVTARVGLVSATNIAGYAFVTYVIRPRNTTIYGSLSFLTNENRWSSISTGFRAVRSITGIKYLLGTGGAERNVFVGAAALFFLALVLAATLLWLRDRGREGNALYVILSLCWLSFFAVLSINAVVELSIRSIYLFIWYPLVAVSGVIVYRNLKAGRRAIFTGILSLAVLCNLAASYGNEVDITLKNPHNSRSDVVEWMEENGRDILYGEWYMAAEIAAYSDGSVTAGAWSGTPFEILPYINPEGIYSEADNARAAIVVMDFNREAVLSAARERGAQLRSAGKFGSYEVYISDKQIMSYKQ